MLSQGPLLQSTPIKGLGCRRMQWLLSYLATSIQADLCMCFQCAENIYCWIHMNTPYMNRRWSFVCLMNYKYVNMNEFPLLWNLRFTLFVYPRPSIQFHLCKLFLENYENPLKVSHDFCVSQWSKAFKHICIFHTIITKPSHFIQNYAGQSVYQGLHSLNLKPLIGK